MNENSVKCLSDEISNMVGHYNRSKAYLQRNIADAISTALSNPCTVVVDIREHVDIFIRMDHY